MYRLVVLLCLSAVSAQLEVDGPCNLTHIAHENSISYSITGLWYQIERIPNSVENGECSQSHLRISIDGVIDVSWTLVQTGYKYDSEVVGGKLVLRNGTITNITDSGVVEMTYGDTAQDFVVLGTDYTEYLVLYSCQNSGSRSKISAWKFGRNTTYSESATNTTRSLAANANIKSTAWKSVSHSEAACRVKSGGMSLRVSPIILLMAALVLSKEFL